MKKLKKLLVVSLCVFLLAGCGEKTIPKLDNGEEVLTTFKENKKISVNELYSKLKSRYGLNILLDMVDQQILEDKYSGDVNAAKENASSTMEQLKTSYGDGLLEAIQYYTGFTSLEEYENSLYINYLKNKAVTDYAKSNIKDSDINKYYKDEVKPDIKVSHILVTVDYANGASEDDQKQADEDAKKTVNEIISILKDSKNVTETFKELAKEYSKDDTTKNDGGNLGFINTDTLGSSYTNLVNAAYKLKDGEYSTSAVKSELGYHIILRTETKEKASLEEVKDSVIEKLATNYISENQDAQIKAMQELRKEYDLDIIDSDLHQNYVNYIQNSLQKIQEQKEKANSTTAAQ